MHHLKSFARIFAVVIAVSVIMGIPAYAQEGVLKSRLDTDIVIDYQVSGLDEISIGIIPELLPDPDMDFQDEAQVDALADLFLRLALKRDKTTMPEKFTYTISSESAGTSYTKTITSNSHK